MTRIRRPQFAAPVPFHGPLNMVFIGDGHMAGFGASAVTETFPYTMQTTINAALANLKHAPMLWTMIAAVSLDGRYAPDIDWRLKRGYFNHCVVMLEHPRIYDGETWTTSFADIDAWLRARTRAGWYVTILELFDQGFIPSYKDEGRTFNQFLRRTFTVSPLLSVPVGLNANLGYGNPQAAPYYTDSAHIFDDGHDVLAALATPVVYAHSWGATLATAPDLYGLQTTGLNAWFREEHNPQHGYPGIIEQIRNQLDNTQLVPTKSISQGTDPNRPTVTTTATGINGHIAINYASPFYAQSNDFVTSYYAAGAKYGLATLYIRSVPTNAGPGLNAAIAGDHLGYSFVELLNTPGGGFATARFCNFSGAGFQTVSVVVPTGRAVTIEWKHEAGRIYIRTAGGSWGAGVVSGDTDLMTGKLLVGANYLLNFFFDGLMGDLAFANTEPSAANQTLNYAYLRAYWGVQ